VLKSNRSSKGLLHISADLHSFRMGTNSPTNEQ